MLMPKRVKHRKQQRGRMRGKATKGSRVSFGQYAMKAIEPSWITNRQIEAARVAITRHLKRAGKLWIRVFPDKPVTVKPAAVLPRISVTAAVSSLINVCAVSVSAMKKSRRWKNVRP